MSQSEKVFIWMLAAFFLVALADFFPKLAIWLAVLMVMDILLINSKTYANLISQFTGSVSKQ